MQTDAPLTIVTGAESGIGRAIALECARRGHRVVPAGIRAAQLDETRALIERDSGVAVAIQTDITREEQVAHLFDEAIGRFGRLTGVVANAGIAHSLMGLHKVELATLEQVITTNVTGTFLTLRQAARAMLGQAAGGSIVVTGSSTALRPVGGLLPYAASKGAVHAMAKAAAAELAPHQIRVNLLIPGTTATPLVTSIPGRAAAAAAETPMGEIVAPEELARAAAFLLGDDAPHMTGTTMIIDAGRTI